MSKNTSSKARNMMYTQQIQYLPTKTVDLLLELIEKKLSPKKYALILHDKDTNEDGTPEAHHVHVMLSFKNGRYANNVAKVLKDKPQYVEIWRGDSRNGYSYLIHTTTDAQSKYQYATNEVVANFDYAYDVSKSSSEVAKSAKKSMVNILLDSLYAGTITKVDVEKNLTGSQYARNHRAIEDICSKRLKIMADEWKTKMREQGLSIKVIWIFGESGVGKSLFAKKYAKKVGNDSFVSGSTRDIFQGYAGEHTIILDELRASSMPYQDLLRITDPYGIDTQVMAPSRYSDKALACDLFIITSPFDPYQFYKKQFYEDDSIDSYKQLLRRLTLVIKMDIDEIYSTKFNSEKMLFIKDKSTVRPNPYSMANFQAPTENSAAMFNSMFDE